MANKEECAICKKITRRKFKAVLIWAILVTIALAVVLTLYLGEGNIGGTTTEYDVQIHDNGGEVNSVVGDKNITAGNDIHGTITNEGYDSNTLIICVTVLISVIVFGGVLIYVNKNRP